MALDGVVLEQIRSRIGAKIRWLPGCIQLADILTKIYDSAPLFERMSSKLRSWVMRC